jgi:organic radical activating enzyme
MNYYDNPYMISADEIITDINSLLEVVDHLHMIGLLGGEPFLNRELGKIINHIHEHEKVSLIVIVTNGTIVPKEDLLELMQNKKILISISYYGDKSKKIVDKLKEYKISFELVKFDYWADLGNFDFRNRRKEEMIKVFDNCYQPKICWNMLHGEFHLCHRSSIGNDLGLIPRSSKDFVDLKSDDSIKLKREQLLKLINSKFINACNYCDGCEKEQIPAGVQN